MWSTILTAAEIADFHARTAKLDPAFAERERLFYESRTADQLTTLAHQAWFSNDSTQYMLAKSYLAIVDLEYESRRVLVAEMNDAVNAAVNEVIDDVC